MQRGSQDDMLKCSVLIFYTNEWFKVNIWHCCNLQMEKQVNGCQLWQWREAKKWNHLSWLHQIKFKTVNRVQNSQSHNWLHLTLRKIGPIWLEVKLLNDGVKFFAGTEEVISPLWQPDMISGYLVSVKTPDKCCYYLLPLRGTDWRPCRSALRTQLCDTLMILVKVCLAFCVSISPTFLWQSFSTHPAPASGKMCKH